MRVSTEGQADRRGAVVNDRRGNGQRRAGQGVEQIDDQIGAVAGGEVAAGDGESAVVGADVSSGAAVRFELELDVTRMPPLWMTFVPDSVTVWLSGLPVVESG